LRIETDSIDDQTVVCRLSGELDAYTAPDLRDTLDEQVAAGCRWIIVDLADLKYLDSTGLGILVGTAKKCRQADGDLAVACNARNLLKIFQISGTQEILNVVPDVDAAMKRLRELAQARGETAGDEEGT